MSEIVGTAVARLPEDTPPDQAVQIRIKLEGGLLKQLREARENGGVDYYLPVDTMHGVLISASFVVTEIVPDASAPEEITGKVLANLMTGEGAGKPVDVADTVWSRSETIMERPADETLTEDTKARKVEYITASPSDQRRWIIVTFTTVGDGDPEGEFSLLMVELFDAIMSTWRWLEVS